jgi:DNA-directed RNA polymerase subunit beta'
MSLNITITKKILEAIVHETFSNFGFLSSSSLLDSLKLLGFFYATNAGISINIEDLKTPDVKKRYIQTANIEIEKISQAWSEGIVSDQERFQSIIDSWNIATESLKNRIVEYYQDFDPANNLYIMAFSGARGNMSQVRQLVGMRGLMSDQEGKIIDLPIQSNFREGLSSIDYIISSYGARKGIVDTALKTADSGYLTRRLIYLAQDLIIREFDCKTKKGIIVLLRKNSSTKNLIGRHLLLAKEGKFPFSIISNLLKNHDEKRNTILNTQILEKLKAISPVILTIRSSLTCQSNGSICQKCYGWDLAHEKLISLGENVGIIAAQSIGEPGTQLTMRTFHTGGIFTGETLKQFVAPFSGKLIIPESLKTIFYRTNHGVDVLKLQQEAQIKLLNWKGIETNLFLEIGSYLYISKTTFVYKGQLISEFLNQTSVSSQRKLKPIYTRIGGKVLCEDLIPSFRKIRKGKTRRILLKQGLLWIASGKIFTLPSEAEYFFSKNLMINQKKAIARLKIITPKEGIISLTNASISIITKQEKIKINLTNFYQQINNCSIKIIPLVRNYQYVDKYTVIAFIYIFPSFSTGNIIAIEEKPSKNTNTFFITTEKDIWNIYGSINLLTPHRKRDLNFPVCNI